jgi:hypothetical protein
MFLWSKAQPKNALVTPPPFGNELKYLRESVVIFLQFYSVHSILHFNNFITLQLCKTTEQMPAHAYSKIRQICLKRFGQNRFIKLTPGPGAGRSDEHSLGDAAQFLLPQIDAGGVVTFGMFNRDAVTTTTTTTTSANTTKVETTHQVFKKTVALGSSFFTFYRKLALFPRKFCFPYYFEGKFFMQNHGASHFQQKMTITNNRTSNSGCGRRRSSGIDCRRVEPGHRTDGVGDPDVGGVPARR